MFPPATSAYCARVAGRQRAAQHQQRAVLVAVLALGRADALAAAALLRHRRDGSVPAACASRPDRATSAAASGCCPASGGCGCRSTCPASRTATPGRCRPATASCSSTPACTTAARWPTSSARSTRPATRSSDVRLIVITHAHIDHCGQAPPLAERAGCEVWMHPRWKLHASPARPRPHDRGRAPERRARGAAAALGRAPPRPRDRPGGHAVRDRDLVPGVTVETDARDLDVVETPGHAPSHVCLHQPEQRLLISGDHLLGRVSQYFDVGYTPDPVGEFLHSLDVVDALDARLALAGHARPFTDVPRPHPGQPRPGRAQPRAPSATRWPTARRPPTRSRARSTATSSPRRWRAGR